MHLSKLIKLHVLNAYILFRVNDDTSVKCIFKTGPQMANFHRHSTCEEAEIRDMPTVTQQGNLGFRVPLTAKPFSVSVHDLTSNCPSAAVPTEWHWSWGS